MKKIILITGASRGIGRNIAYNLAISGYKVIANYNNSEECAKELQNELKENGIDIDIYKADVSKSEEARGLVNFVLDKYKRIDVLINNAGIAEEKLFTDISDEDFDKMIKNNMYSVFYTTQEAVKFMLKEHNGQIINISSYYSLCGGSCEVPYSMSKAGVDGMTKSLAKELGPSNIRVNSIAPGAIDTEMNSYVSKEAWEEVIKETPLGKIGKPIDITKCVKWLIEDDFTTGQIISPNGGIAI